MTRPHGTNADTPGTRPQTREEILARWRLTDYEYRLVSKAATQLGKIQGFQVKNRGPGRHRVPMETPDSMLSSPHRSERDTIRLMHATVDLARVRGQFVSNCYNQADWRRWSLKKRGEA